MDDVTLIVEIDGRQRLAPGFLLDIEEVAMFAVIGGWAFAVGRVAVCRARIWCFSFSRNV